MTEKDHRLPNLTDEIHAQQDAVSLMMNMAADTEKKLNRLTGISDKLSSSHASLQDVIVSGNQSLRKAEIVYKGLIISGLVVCILAIASVFYSVHLSNEAVRQHRIALEGLKAEYDSTSQSLKAEVDRLQEHLVLSYKGALDRLSGIYEAKFQALSEVHKAEVADLHKSYRASVQSLAEEHQLATVALKKAFDADMESTKTSFALRVKELERQVEVARAKQHAAETQPPYHTPEWFKWARENGILDKAP